MGNCCEAVDSKLEELLHSESLMASESTFCHSRTVSSSTNELLATNATSEDLPKKFIKFRYPKQKLNTIIEDRQEDLINSPFLLKRLKYTQLDR